MQPSGDRDRLVRRSNGTAPVRALLCGLGAGLLGLATLTACTSGGDTVSSLAGGQSPDGTSTATTASPGKYQELPQPCDTVTRNTLKSLLPGAADYAGKAALTYDTDRRVGCTWSTTNDGGQGGSRYLTVDLERVVSFDPAVSDESAAERYYDTKAVAAGIPVTVVSPSSTSSGSASAPPAADGSPSPSPSAPSSSAPESESAPESSSGSAPASASPSNSDDAPGSRVLSDLGNDAYLDDVVATRDSGVHRDITIVFREANVLITVKLSQWSGDKAVVPAGHTLRDGAQSTAQEIARQFD